MDENEEFGCGASCSSCHSCCSHDHDNEEFDLEMEDSIITFTDEEGNDIDFQILDALTVDEKQYLVVMPCEDEESEDVGVVILEIKDEDGEEVYDTVIDDELAEKVFQEFKKANELE